MQVGISNQERADLILLSTGRGKTKWFLEKSGVSYTPLFNLRKPGGTAEDYLVEKVRAAIKSPEAKRLLKKLKVVAA